MTDSVELSNVHVFAEAHKGTRGGPSDHRSGPAAATGRLVELSVGASGTVAVTGRTAGTSRPSATCVEQPALSAAAFGVTAPAGACGRGDDEHPPSRTTEHTAAMAHPRPNPPPGSNGQPIPPDFTPAWSTYSRKIPAWATSWTS
jgi:hypothetical protein